MFPITDLDLDPLFSTAAQLVVTQQKASASLFQRHLDIGYARAARILDQLEKMKIVGPGDGAAPRKILIQSIEELKKIEIPEPIPETVPTKPVEYTQPSSALFQNLDLTPWNYSILDVIGDSKFSNESYLMPLGFTSSGALVANHFSDFKHLLITGNSSSQKEIHLDSTILSLCFRYTPNELKIVMVDTGYQLNLYNHIPHLIVPVVNDFYKVVNVVQWLINERHNRMKTVLELKTRDYYTVQEKLLKDQITPILLIINNLDLAALDAWNTTKEGLEILLTTAHQLGIHIIATATRTDANAVPKSVRTLFPTQLQFGLDDEQEVNVALKERFGTASQEIQPIYSDEQNINAFVDEVKA